MNNWKRNSKCKECRDCGALHFDNEGNCTEKKCWRDGKQLTEEELIKRKGEQMMNLQRTIKIELKKNEELKKKCEKCEHLLRLGDIQSSAFDPVIIFKCKLGLKPETC